jgi:hypothetical protein
VTSKHGLQFCWDHEPKHQPQTVLVPMQGGAAVHLKKHIHRSPWNQSNGQPPLNGGFNGKIIYKLLEMDDFPLLWLIVRV